MAWVLTPGLQSWRGELDSVFPERDKTSSGAVGDLAHQGGRSGHNPDRTGNAEYKDGDALDEVRAVDEDADLVPGSGIDWMWRVISHVLKIARAGEYVPFRYIIYRPKGSGQTYIWHRSYGWAARKYTGANLHGEHAHFSGDYTQKADGWTGTLGIRGVRYPPSDGGSGGGAQERKTMELKVTIPELKQGDDDAKISGYNLIERLQRIVKVDDDGVWGPATTAGIAAWTKLPASQCKVLNERIYRLVFGAWEG